MREEEFLDRPLDRLKLYLLHFPNDVKRVFLERTRLRREFSSKQDEIEKLELPNAAREESLRTLTTEYPNHDVVNFFKLCLGVAGKDHKSFVKLVYLIGLEFRGGGSIFEKIQAIYLGVCEKNNKYFNYYPKLGICEDLLKHDDIWPLPRDELGKFGFKLEGKFQEEFNRQAKIVKTAVVNMRKVMDLADCIYSCPQTDPTIKDDFVKHLQALHLKEKSKKHLKYFMIGVAGGDHDQRVYTVQEHSCAYDGYGG